MKNIKIAILALLTSCYVGNASAQSFAIKTNLAGWAACIPNIGTDLILTETSSIDFTFYQSVTDSWLKEARITGMQIGYRYWLAHQPMQDFFVGATIMPTFYDLDINGRKHEGSSLPLGVNFGYSWPIGKKWSIEASYGVGILFYNTRIHWENNYTTRDRNASIAPTHIALNISYILK